MSKRQTTNRLADACSRSIRKRLGVACLTALIALFAPRTTHAESVSREGAKALQEGNQRLAEQKYVEALAAYDKAAESMPGSAEVAYNRGIALYRLGSFEKAQTAFQDALRPERPDLEAKAKYNLGLSAHANAMAHKDDLQAAVKDLDRAIAFYKDSLELRKDDADARHNLAAAEQAHAFFKKKLELLKQQSESQPSSQPGEKSDEKSDDKSDDQKQSDDKNQNPSSQPSESDQKGDKQQSDDKQQPSSQPNDDSNDNQDQQNQNDARDQNDSQNDQKEGEEPPSDLTGDNKNDNQSQDQNQNEDDNKNANESQSTETQPAEQPPASQPATSQPTSMPSGGDQKFDIQQLTREQALQMLQTARDAERKRREMQRQMKLRQQGRIPVDKDW